MTPVPVPNPVPTPKWENFPAEMIALPRWVLWRLEVVDGRPTKVPYQVSGRKALTSQPQTWSTFEAVRRAYEKGGWSGVGFCRAEGYVFLDLDGCLDPVTGEWIDWPDWPEELQPRRIFGRLEGRGYFERSVSGTGVHGILFAAQWRLIESLDLHVPNTPHCGIALYMQSRFFTFSGEVMFEGDYLTDSTNEMRILYAQMAEFRKSQIAKRLAARDAVLEIAPAEMSTVEQEADKLVREIETATQALKQTVVPISGNGHSQRMPWGYDSMGVMTDEKFDDFVQKRRDRKLSLLFLDANWGPLNLADDSHSGADLMLCIYLAFYFRDHGRIDSWFRRSALYREDRWNSPRPGGTYGSITIDKALETQTGQHTPPRPVGRPPVSREFAERPPDQDSSRVDSSPPPDGLGTTDLDNALRFLSRHGENLRYLRPAKAWYGWNGAYWERDENKPIAEPLAHELAEYLVYEGRKSQSEKLIKCGLRLKSTTGMNAMFAKAKALDQFAISADDFDSHPYYTNASNLTVDVRTGETHEHRREDFLTSVMPVDYDPTAQSDVWDAYFGSVQPDPENREYLQRAAGYTLTGSTREECAFLLYGPGRNGKGAFILVLQTLLGGFAGTANFNTFLRSGRDNTAEIADMRGKRMIASQESGTASTFSEATVKSLTGGDRISAKRLYENPVSFIPQFKIWFATNFLPEARDPSSGFWHRIKVIRFPVSFAGREDKDLKQRLLQPDVLRAAFACFVEGAIRCWQDGLGTTPQIEADTQQYREESDYVSRFIEERCDITDPDAMVQPRELYQAYSAWSEGINERPVSETTFGRRLPELGFAKNRTMQARFYLGIRLK